MADINTLRRNCSHQTIQSDSRGQFGELWKRVQDLNNYSKILDEFKEKKTNYERIRYSFPFLDCIQLLPIFRKKDFELAEKYRKEGNDAFKKKEFNPAMKLYNMAILNASHQTSSQDRTLSLAVANRSACWFHLGESEWTIQDIHYAIAMGYPDECKYKLYIRLSKAQRRMGWIPKAKTSLMIAKAALAKVSDEATRSSVLGQIEQEVQLTDASPSGHNLAAAIHPAAPTSTSADTDAKVRIEFNQDMGRHVVANEAIRVGELILEERPYAAALYPEKFGSHCQECFQPLRAFVPCPTCSGVAFCSPECAQRGNTSYHGVECQYTEALRGFGCSQVARLALRMISQRPLVEMLSLRMQLQVFNTQEVTPHDTDPYVQVYNLSGNEEQRDAEDQLERTLMAGLLLKLLDKGGYFAQSHTSDFEFYFIGSLLLRNLEVLQFNAHEVYEVLRPNPTSLVPFKNHQIALAIYPRASYFNHSCHGQVGRYFKGKTMGIRVLREIPQGRQIFDNYGPTFYMNSFNERQREIDARYWFQCACQPCQENWPLLARLPKSYDDERDNQTQSLERKESEQDPMTLFREGNAAMNSGELETAMNSFSLFLQQTAHPSLMNMRMPSQSYIKGEDKLRTCISNCGDHVSVNKLPNA